MEDIAPLIAEEQHELQQKHQRTITATPTTQPINKRLIGIKPNTMPSPSHSKYKRDSYPASSESFVVLSRSKVAPTIASKSSPAPSITVSNTGHSSQTIAENNSSISLGPSSLSTLTALDNNNWARNNSLSHRLKVANKIFDIMSSKSSADHPMCQECTDMLLESLEKQLDDVGRERDCYINFMKKVKNSVVTDEEQQELKSQVNEVRITLFHSITIIHLVFS
jgi:beclin 1